MLIGIHPLLRGELLQALDEMGHGDALVIADANFPARRVGGRVIDLAGSSSPEVMKAIATVFPFDGAEPIVLMRPPDGRTGVQDELVHSMGEQTPRVDELDRFGFYAAASEASVVVLTGESRPYGNALVRKGVVN